MTAAGDPIGAVTTLTAILIAGFAGGSVQFLLARGALRRVLVDLLVRIGLTRERLDALADWLRRRGARGVAVARATPGVRVGAIAASGLAALPPATFLTGLVIGNTVFVAGDFALGYAIGPTAIGLIAGSSGAAIAIAIVAVLAIAGPGGWSLVRRRRAASGSRDASTTESDAGASGSGDAGAYGSWADAACPACLAIAVARSVPVIGRRA